MLLSTQKMMNRQGNMKIVVVNEIVNEVFEEPVFRVFSL